MKFHFVHTHLQSSRINWPISATLILSSYRYVRIVRRSLTYMFWMTRDNGQSYLEMAGEDADALEVSKVVSAPCHGSIHVVESSCTQLGYPICARFMWILSFFSLPLFCPTSFSFYFIPSMPPSSQDSQQNKDHSSRCLHQIDHILPLKTVI